MFLSPSMNACFYGLERPSTAATTSEEEKKKSGNTTCSGGPIAVTKTTATAPTTNLSPTPLDSLTSSANSVDELMLSSTSSAKLEDLENLIGIGTSGYGNNQQKLPLYSSNSNIRSIQETAETRTQQRPTCFSSLSPPTADDARHLRRDLHFDLQQQQQQLDDSFPSSNETATCSFSSASRFHTDRTDNPPLPLPLFPSHNQAVVGVRPITPTSEMFVAPFITTVPAPVLNPKPMMISGRVVTSCHQPHQHQHQPDPMQKHQQLLSHDVSSSMMTMPTPMMMMLPSMMQQQQQQQQTTLDETYSSSSSSSSNSSTASASSFPPSYKLRGYDIICGRHKAAFNHFGNRRFRVTISIFLDKYLQMTSRTERSYLILEIVDTIVAAGGHFLKFDRHQNSWVELDDKEARNKVGHALRDAAKAAKAAEKRKKKDDAKKSSSYHSSNRDDNNNSKQQQDNVYHKHHEQAVRRSSRRRSSGTISLSDSLFQ